MQIDLETRFGLLPSTKDPAEVDRRTLAVISGLIENWGYYRSGNQLTEVENLAGFVVYVEFFCGGGIRTPDPLLPKQILQFIEAC